MQKHILTLCVLALMAAPLPALAAGESSSKWSGDHATEADLTAKYGDLGANYTAAKTLVKAERYDEAIVLLKGLGKDGDPRVLNYLGFSHRKLGKLDEALEYYAKAIEIEPEYAAVHQYLGEAYVKLGKTDDAKAELVKIKGICGTDCDEYKTLEQVITAKGPKS
ncbi:MAG: tetratricopeptide repeat protein [Methyloligellaceae bacterium]